MAFEPTAWRIGCPECGDRRIAKTTDGSFDCTNCGCVFRHNWRAWILGGMPFCLTFVTLMLEVTSVVEVPRGLWNALLVLSMIALWFASSRLYRVTKHGDSVDEDKAT